MFRNCVLTLVLVALPLAFAGENRLPGDDMIEAYLIMETARLERRYLAGARTKEEWEQRRPKLKEEYMYMLGLWPLPERTPLKPVVTGTLEREDFRVEKVHFQSKPGLYVTGNLYLPKKQEGKIPAVLYVCGHADKGRDGCKINFQQHGIWLATHGYVCLIIDTLQLSEIRGIHHGTYRENRFWWQAAGYTPAGVECWNGIRAIDYLVSRSEVDPERIGVTGISGGGAATVWIAAADERVKAAAPASGHSDLECYVADKTVNGHCDCMFMINTYRWKWDTIAALIAPRPLLFLNSGHDNIFPMSGNERIRGDLETLYGLYTKDTSALFDVGVTPGPHDDNPEIRLMAFRWMETRLKKLNPKDLSVIEIPPKWFEGKELRVFPEDKDIPADQLNTRIDETFVPRATVTLPTDKEQYAHWRAQLFEQLQERVFREWPTQPPVARAVEKKPDGTKYLATEPLITVSAVETASLEKGKRFCVVVLNADEPAGKVPEWAKAQLKDDDGVLVLNPRGSGELDWTKKNPPNFAIRALALLGRTVDTGRVYDIQATARMCHQSDGLNRAICVMGKGQAGILAAYAGLQDSCISQVVIAEPPVSHKEGPTFLNVLRVLDIPHALGMLAPRTLTLVNAPQKEFEITAAIYKAAGAEENFKR